MSLADDKKYSYVSDTCHNTVWYKIRNIFNVPEKHVLPSIGVFHYFWNLVRKCFFDSAVHQGLIKTSIQMCTFRDFGWKLFLYQFSWVSCFLNFHQSHVTEVFLISSQLTQPLIFQYWDEWWEMILRYEWCIYVNKS